MAFVVPDEKPARLRVKKEKGDAFAYALVIPGDVSAFDLRLRENQRDCFSCDPELMVLPVVFEHVRN